MKNAFEAVQVDAPVRQVTITTSFQDEQPDKPEVLFSVSDSGCGIPVDILPNLFDPYVSSKQSGSGLGLSIVKKIVEEHSARVQAKNNETHGASVMIHFPVEVNVQNTQYEKLEVGNVG